MDLNHQNHTAEVTMEGANAACASTADKGDEEAPHNNNSSSSSLGDFAPVALEDDDLREVPQEDQQQQQQEQQQEDDHFVMQWNTQNPNDESFSSLSKPPPRKMTSASDATSITAASSFTDYDALDDACLYDVSKGKPLQPPCVLGALDEIPDEGLSSKDHDDSIVGNGSDGDLLDDRSTSADKQAQYLVWFKRFLLFLVIFGTTAFLAVLIGAAVEKRKFSVASDTSRFYFVPSVCGVHMPLTDEEIQGTTFASKQDAQDNGADVAHCGDCGACSTAHDMQVMAHTAESLTRDSTRCAFKIFLGRKAVEKCMEKLVGFTPACEDCWLDNISCSFKACKFTCIKYKLFRQDNNKGQDEELNDCLKCDERMCGPGFIQCSGANRRRMGIVSDIGRDAELQCPSVDVDWDHLMDNIIYTNTDDDTIAGGKMENDDKP